MLRNLVVVIIICISCGVNINGLYAQRVERNDARLESIKRELEYLSATEVPGLSETANFSVVNTPLQELLRGIAETHLLNISMDPDISIKVTNNFNQVIVRDLLYFLCREYNLDIRFTGSIMSFYAYQSPQPEPKVYQEKKLEIAFNKKDDKLTAQLTRDSLTVFARQLTQASGKNVIIASDVRDQVINGYIQEVPFEQGLEKIAFANNLSLRKTEDGFFIIESRQSAAVEELPVNVRGRRPVGSNATGNRQPAVEKQVTDGFIEITRSVVGSDTLLSLEAVNMPIAYAIEEASLELGKDYVFFTRPEGNTTCHIKQVSYEGLLSYLLQNTQHTFKKQDNIYMIGARNQEGLRASSLIRMQFRAVVGIEEVIPAELKQGVEIKVFPELNSLIVSGSQPRINEIRAFLNTIDQLVPNILIEVIVADVRKGASVQTGIKAYLSDSVPRTGGQLFPGLDVTLNAKSINDLLGLLGDKGIINLGRVTPNFYMTLQALEQNNLMNTRSTPKLSTLNGHEALLSIGQSRYFLEETQNITGGVSPINTVTQRYREVQANLAIKIHPFVAADEHITLNIEAEFSDFIEPEQEGFPPGNATRKFVSKIRIRNEEMIVLGGLEEVRKTDSGSGFPLLSRIPVLKWLFSSRSRASSDSRLIVFIKPTIVY